MWFGTKVKSPSQRVEQNESEENPEKLAISEYRKIFTYNWVLDDSLLPILILPSTLSRNKIVLKISFFYFSFLVATTVAVFSVIIITDQWNLLFTRYFSLVGGLFIVLVGNILSTMKFWHSVLGIHQLHHAVSPQPR